MCAHTAKSDLQFLVWANRDRGRALVSFPFLPLSLWRSFRVWSQISPLCLTAAWLLFDPRAISVFLSQARPVNLFALCYLFPRLYRCTQLIWLVWQRLLEHKHPRVPINSVIKRELALTQSNYTQFSTNLGRLPWLPVEAISLTDVRIFVNRGRRCQSLWLPSGWMTRNDGRSLHGLL